MHRNQSYLLLGPFKFEQLNQNPEVGLIHDFTPDENIQKIQKLARGKMMSTPYTTNGKIKGFSKYRTSKVLYMNEKMVPDAMDISKRIELVTGLGLYHEQFASENYHIMNYGIGGSDGLGAT